MKNMFRALLLLAFYWATAATAGDWITDEKSECKAWNKYPAPNETISWSGACLNGFASGDGTLKFFANGIAGSETTCRFVNGKCEGKGITVSAKGTRYEGDFVNDERTGRGVFVWSDGGRYEGDFVNGRMTGKGISIAAKGNRYEGDFVDNQRHGKGLFTWTDGSRYTGDWVNGKMSGYGEMRFKDGSSKRGVWVDDKLDKPCTSDSACTELKTEFAMPLVNCKVNDVDLNKEYRGECVNGLAHGKGRAKGRDIYVGDFKNGNKHGQGKYSWASGDSFEGSYVDDKKTYGKFVFKSGTSYTGDFLGTDFNGYGVRTYSCNCSFWSCNTCTDQGWWQADKLTRSCNSRESCIKLNELEPVIRKAERELRCEDAKKSNQALEALNAGIFYFDSCVKERKFNTVLKGSDPQAMYLAAGRYESDGERSRAKTIYRELVDRFAKNPLAIKATDRLTRLADVESVESSNSNAAYQVQSANDQSREAAYKQCMNNYSACLSRCDHKSSCTSGCSLCSR